MDIRGVSYKLDQYFELENCFTQFEDTLNKIPKDNGYKISIKPNDDNNKFEICISNRRLLVNFSSFGEVSSRFLGEITFEIQDDEEKRVVIHSLYFDEYGNNSNELNGNANTWSINKETSIEPLLLTIIEKYLLLRCLNNQIRQHRQFSDA